MFAFTSTDNSLLRLVLLTIALLTVTSTTRALPVQLVELDARGGSQSKPAHCPSVNDIEAHIKQKSGGTLSNTVYWSHPGSMTQAHTLAKTLSGHYIYDYVSNEDIAAWGKLCTPAEQKALWARASYAFAKLSSGTAYVVTTTANSDAIWTKYEFPVLKGTGLINSVLSVDPANPKKFTQLFTKNPLGNPPLPAEP
ncbi:hypothetical protein GALMADRAFT_135219 [Galerina marginata CBS 339.88]|uniref:SCP domain-containing protein n=1 Tax=Galerina marginata (strain CBS 339.88) TaxID=685588 RepID=A0A067TPI5_GALM3|nr:hypothetical protein GALMADRAFT_135219 [Galerina marginata CBS 339.88]